MNPDTNSATSFHSGQPISSLFRDYWTVDKKLISIQIRNVEQEF